MTGRSSGSGVVIDAKVAAQLSLRGWTKQEVRDIVALAPIGVSTDNTGNRNEPASVYGSRIGGYVVINDVTRRAVQVSDRNDPGWVPDSRINWV